MRKFCRSVIVITSCSYTTVVLIHVDFNANTIDQRIHGSDLFCSAGKQVFKLKCVKLDVNLTVYLYKLQVE